MAKTATRGRRRKSSAKSRHNGQGGALAWLFVGAFAVGGIALYDNWKTVRPILASRVPDASVITAAIKPDAPKAAVDTNSPRQQAAWQSQSPRLLPHAAVPIPSAQPVKLASAGGSPALSENASAAFGYCGQGRHINCVGDGGTFWYKGEKILIADVVVPAVGAARCADERRAGFAAKSRLLKLLNAGPFVMNAAGKADGAGAPRVISRNGLSFGSQLVAEGLARKPGGPSGGWCA